MRSSATRGRSSIDGAGLAITTDSFVVKPIRFPGGSIGELAVNGTVNDLAAPGPAPLALSVLAGPRGGVGRRRAAGGGGGDGGAAERRGVEIVTGDTKVVERGHCDSMYVCTTGLGRVDARAALSTRAIEPGDRVLVSGPMGEHGTAIMLARGELGLDAEIGSDTRSLWPAADALLDAAGPGLRACATRRAGGSPPCSTSSHAPPGWRSGERGRRARAAGGRGSRRAPGDRPVYVANEGVLVAFVAPGAADAALAALRSVAGFEEAAEIGEVRTEPPGMVLVDTAFGGRRVMDLLAGDPLPRIC